MARLYIDADVAPPTITRLRLLNHIVTTASERGMEAAHDEEQLALAWSEQRTLITHNFRDYRLLHRAWSQWQHAWQVVPTSPHFGILIIPQKPLLPHDAAALRLDDLLSTGDELAGRLQVWKPSTGWTLIDA
jgi:hypothetical protein